MVIQPFTNSYGDECCVPPDNGNDHWVCLRCFQVWKLSYMLLWWVWDHEVVPCKTWFVT